MFLPRPWALLVAAAALAVVSAAATLAEPVLSSPFHGRRAAEWAWSASTDDESCWGSADECPVAYDLDADAGGAAGVGRRRLQYYYEVDTAAPTGQHSRSSYSALMRERRDSVPCSVPGASYYNCQPGADADPYKRGCSAITQCRD